MLGLNPEAPTEQSAGWAARVERVVNGFERALAQIYNKTLKREHIPGQGSTFSSRMPR